MNRSPKRMMKVDRSARMSRVVLRKVPLATAISAILASAAPVHAQDQASDAGVLGEVMVTAQKRTENLQEVPLSIQAFGTEQLEELNIKDFEDYMKFLPSVTFTTLGPGFALPYFRGVASGENNNHSGPQPTVGMYLDEQPITTIQGPLDIHLYDIARVEALAGPQGTLYGASSEAGTIRIITNKPDPSGFKAGYGLEGNYMSEGGTGYLAEAFANIPLSENAAVRLVGWYRHDAGYIDNVAGERTFPTSGITINNNDRAEDDYNDVDTFGLRAALKIDLNDNWSITPTVMAQEQKSNGSFGFDTTVGELELTHFYPEEAKDSWAQAALTVEGKVGNFDVTYAGSFLKRDVDTESDYSDYSYWYDVVYSYGGYITNNDGDLINPSQFISGRDHYKRYVHELRFASPADRRVRFVGGVFLSRQEHGIEQRYQIDDFNDSLEVEGWPDTLWLTEQLRVDRDKAIFGEVSFDITDKLTATGGLRFFKTENSLEGFFGFGLGYDELVGLTQGEIACPGGTPAAPDFTDAVSDAPCVNLDKVTEDDDHIEKLNLSYKFTDDAMGYITYSKGFRPGGINRRASLPAYKPDFLTSYELGWKSTWANNRLRFNGAFFLQQWDDFQFSILGANGLTEIKNANQAEIKGVEADITWAATDMLTLSGGFAYLDAKLTENYCGVTDENGNPITTDPCPTGDDPPDDFAPPQAPDGTRLPITPKLKANLTARLDFPLGGFDAHVQASGVYQGDRRADLRLAENEILGDMPSYVIADLSGGISNDIYSFELFISNVTDKRAELYKTVQCSEGICGQQIYLYTNAPRTIGLRFGQKF